MTNFDVFSFDKKRVGNYFRDSKGVVKVVETDDLNPLSFPSFKAIQKPQRKFIGMSVDYTQAISIDEDYLIEFGFTKNENDRYQNENFMISKLSNNFFGKFMRLLMINGFIWVR